MRSVTYEPPLVKVHGVKRDDRTVVIGHRRLGYVESPHARMVNRCIKHEFSYEYEKT